MVFAWTSVQADDLKVADDFKSGDLVSADTFNQIFDTLEKINRTVVDADLVGVWSCSSLLWRYSSKDVSDWSLKGFAYLSKESQLNMTASSEATSIESAYSFSTSAPTPFKVWPVGDQLAGAANTGSYILYKGIILFKESGNGFNGSTISYQVDLVSDSRFILRNPYPIDGHSGIIICDSAAAVPAAPTSPEVTNNKTSLNLAWTDASSDETGFKVYRKLSSESEAKLVATQTTATYSDTDLTEGQIAYYHVTAYNDNGESAKTKTVSATLDATPPTVIATSPSNGEQVARTKQVLSITFSEEVEVICPSDPSVTNYVFCSDYSASPPINVAVLVLGIADSSRDTGTEGMQEARRFSWIVDPGDSGVTLSGDMFGNNDWLSARDTLTVTVDKDWIRDKNGIQMAADYVFTFTTP